MSEPPPTPSLAARAARRAARILLLTALVLALLALLAYWLMFVDPGPHPRDQPVHEEGQAPELVRLEQALRAHVTMLAGTIGERNVARPAELARAAAYVETTLSKLGYAVEPQVYPVGTVQCKNLAVTRKGTGSPDEIVLVGAHYDSVIGAPGANDNGSGTAALLELARLWARRSAKRTVRFVALTNEEPPHFMTGNWGGRVYAKAAKARGDKIRAMLSLETLGYYTNEPKSQHYPPLFNLLYPDTGNFVGVVGNLDSRKLVREVTRELRQATRMPSQCVATFGWITGIGWSDHAAFWEQGYQAVMLTDTAPFRYPHYHRTTDTPDKLDYASLARVTLAVDRVVAALAD